MPAVVRVLAGALIGAYAWSGPGRDRIRWFVDTLPVSRSYSMLNRMGSERTLMIFHPPGVFFSA